MRVRFHFLYIRRYCFFFAALLFPSIHEAQVIPFDDLSYFRAPGKNWQITGGVKVDPSQYDVFNVKPGNGILVNLPDANQKSNLETIAEHGDLELEFEYMLAKGASSGIYLQGRYEIQLSDGWLVKGASENGSIYGSRPARQNASRAPGLWQHIKVIFRAPRFDVSGRKTENARIVILQLNGVLVHENVDLSLQAGEAALMGEAPRAALLIQGDSGKIAFRNIRFKPLETPPTAFHGLHYTVYEGRFVKYPDLKAINAYAEGDTDKLSSGVAEQSNNYLVRYTGTVRIFKPDEYKISLVADAGYSQLVLDGKRIFDWGNPERRSTRKVTLQAGELPFELVYSKVNSETESSLGLTLSSSHMLPVFSGDPQAAFGRYDYPGAIYVDALAPRVLRSFMDIDSLSAGTGSHRITHAISVGHPDQIHYTYDLNYGSVVQVWRGEFLEATPMWRGRGDGSSRPRGVTRQLGIPRLVLNKLPSASAPWAVDTTGSAYQPDGYCLDDEGLPTFRYTIYGSKVLDAIRPISSGEGIRRKIAISDPLPGLYMLLGYGSKVEALGDGIYSIGDQEYYIKLDDDNGRAPIIRDSDMGQELIISVKNEPLTYSIWF